MSRAGIDELNNRVIFVRRGNVNIALAGLDDITENLHDIHVIEAQLSADTFAILLAHEPDIADEVSKTGKIDLQLSGHTHGGQVILPLVHAPILPKHGKRYPRGLYQIKNMRLYTNSGLGTAELDFRYHCPPEIALFILENTKPINNVL
jgi:hypothetical protein